MNNNILHSGTPRHSGRYPWGSGKTPQRNKDFHSQVYELKKKGLSESEIAKGFGIKTTNLRINKSISSTQKKLEEAQFAWKLKEKGYSNTAIAKRLNKNESSVRSLLNSKILEKAEEIENTAQLLRDAVKKKEYIDVGRGAEAHLNITRNKLNTVVGKLVNEEGYVTVKVQEDQLGTGKKTTLKVLASKGTTYKDVVTNMDKISTVHDLVIDSSGKTSLGIHTPTSIDSKRILVRYSEDGGSQKDGLIELRRGVPDISLGNSKYAQVRIAVDNTHYLKGMAVHVDNLPPGKDIIFNTNKSKTVPMMDNNGGDQVFKSLKLEDKDNPFGSTIKYAGGQTFYKDKNGKEKLSAINKVYEEGDWMEWSKTLSSQVLSKQPPKLAKKQLEAAYNIKKEEYDEIMALSNSTVRKHLLSSFADDCDSSAIHLKAAALPRQASHVLLPFPGIKETEIYAPNYSNGQSVALIRYPHGGIFEIPQLIVNNKYPKVKSIIGNAKDAVGINHKVAEQLSGADFDGDTVLVIPNPKNLGLRSEKQLTKLIGFDPKSYKLPKEANEANNYLGYKLMTKAGTQLEMGKISNLITDMTIKGAPNDELVRAIKHSMVVIDAEKHKLNYTQSAKDNNIAALKQNYQGGSNAGAATLISKASSRSSIFPPRTEKFTINKLTGEKEYVLAEKSTYINKQGKEIKITTRSQKMADVKDAFELSSGTMIEAEYATHANKLKSLANQARKEYIVTKPISYNPSAAKTYAKEVSQLKAHLNIAKKGALLERHAQLFANNIIKAKIDDDPSLSSDSDRLKKVRHQALAEARSRFNSKKENIPLTSQQWAAIQAGAITSTRLIEILRNTDIDKIKQLATPRTAITLTPAKASRARLMLQMGKTQSEIASVLGIPVHAIAELM